MDHLPSLLDTPHLLALVQAGDLAAAAQLAELQEPELIAAYAQPASMPQPAATPEPVPAAVPAAAVVAAPMTAAVPATAMSQAAAPQPLAPVRLATAPAHSVPVPVDSGYAAFDNADAVPVRAEGKARYLHYLTLPSPKAFAIYQTGGWRFSSGSAEAIPKLLNYCIREGQPCWLYAVDNQVVWQEALDKRISRPDQLTH